MQEGDRIALGNDAHRKLASPVDLDPDDNTLTQEQIEAGLLRLQQPSPTPRVTQPNTPVTQDQIADAQIREPSPQGTPSRTPSPPPQQQMAQNPGAKELRLAAPKPFTGDFNQAETFILACELYLTANEETYDTEGKRIA
ncbi:hypothetical protein AX16_002185 [Volvariella volvacea WC 439]|nr:hypothetical protein AX16_002185 [Volvariella volvacea WC 439]